MRNRRSRSGQLLQYTLLMDHPPAWLGVHAGFGRIGRLVLRATLKRKDVNVVAVNGKLFAALCAFIAAMSTLRSCSNVTVTLVASVRAQTPSLNLSMLPTCSRCVRAAMCRFSTAVLLQLYCSLECSLAMGRVVSVAARGMHVKLCELRWIQA